MRRVRLPIRRLVLLAGLSLFMIAALLPLHVALGAFGFDERGFGAKEIRGSIWSAALSEAYFGTVPVGDAAARLSLWRLALGEAQLSVDGGETGSFSGKLTGFRSGYALSDADVRIEARQLGLPGAGGLQLSDAHVRFEEGMCVSASGTAASDMLASLAGETGLPGAALTGTLSCEGDAAVLPLTGSAAGVDATMTLRLNAAGTLSGQLDVTGLPETNRPALQANGFVPAGPGVYRLTF
ncbi:hypothetical protein B5C34_14630 [Pacificimonas flava]|uniref:Type II secretion system protein N n=2 Tax=Pacificimonas TaxID=1960290 RepID=A0A219B092_9SPHN|nr:MULTISPECIES: type II secretion system protein N [Pacificimonas]MBZ6379801.1 type II secretion system protein N [Pacificimonas aurantium]OWV31745.1 hypothetical protein B5C34_14630 [Pacificimonas flava]